MFFNKKRKRRFWALLSVAVIVSNLAGSIAAYAVDRKIPEKEDKSVLEEDSPKNTLSTESSYVNDTPLRLQVSKIKTPKGTHEGISPQNTTAVQEDTITYRLSGRVEGSEAELIGKYGYDKVELAYSSSGAYLGYGYFTGTLEYLSGRKAQNLDEDLELIYNEHGVFDGYAYVTRKLETADDINRYVAGARMALYEAVEIFRNPAVTRDIGHYGEDERFTGVTVIRDQGSNNVTSVYVNKGYAGTKEEYVLQKRDGTKILIDGNGTVIDRNYQYQDAIDDTGSGVWIAKTIQREDTPILFYSLDNLQITSNDIYTGIGFQNDKLIDQIFGAERPDKKRNLYGFDKKGKVVNITQKDERDFSVFAFEAGTNRPVYEFVGGDYGKIRYSLPEKAIEVGDHTVMYHLDEDGNRDSRVDPQTGIAYIEESIAHKEGHDNLHHVNDTASMEDTKLYVWPVNIFYDGSGAAQGNGNGSRTFQKIMTTRIATIHADTPEEYTTGTYERNSFQKAMNPVLDSYGHPVYYRKSEETYEKGEDRYDYDGDEYLGYTYKDSLDQENENAYRVNPHEELYNGDQDDPFDQSTHYQYSDKQTIRLTVDMDGNYIVNGAGTVPVPVRAGYLFAGWLIEPNRLTDGGRAVARWRNGNTSGMDEAEREQWYSNRPAAGMARTMTVTFEANGGEFRSGSGDIHSADNILYHRLGEAYLMENVWITGENTPNDPFDTQLVNTEENAAHGNHTILGVSETANDVYSGTSAGGEADMLKRVNAGTYIMEELTSPSGYVKSLPVGVTVNEDTNRQYAEMIDRTIKAEFIKTDTSDSQEKGLFINGARQKTDAGAAITVKESKGSWSHRHVAGAVISLKARDDSTKKAFSDWVKVTENPLIVKKEEQGFSYLEFPTDEPLFLEGLPKGNYRLSEVHTPKGFITMADQDITIREEDGVQIYSMKDDHTKVEIEKYQKDGDGKKNLPNAYRAELSLTDRSGEVVSVWKTDDLSDYLSSGEGEEEPSFWQRLASVFSGNGGKKRQSFVELFTEQVNHGDTCFSQISWEVERKAVKAPYATEEKETWIISDGTRIVCTRGSAPDHAPQEFKDAYNTRNLEENRFTYPVTLHAWKDEEASEGLSHQIWNVSDENRMRISIYPSNAGTAAGRRAYEVSFGFHYRDDYTGTYANTISYDTMEGRRRFDYLPAGTYVLKETGTPEGYVTAPEQTIQVEEMGDIQRFTMENKERQLSIAKIAGNEEDYYAGISQGAAVMTGDKSQAAVIPGAALNLYFSETEIGDYKKAFADGMVPDGAILADSWISGSDGRYTEAEYKAESIRFDQVGDYKPHIIKNLQSGWYYLVETETPSYFKTFEVLSIPMTDLSSANLSADIQAVNTPIPLKVKVFKQNEEGTPLAGAVFRVRNKTLGGIPVGTLNTDETGYGTLSVMNIGRFSPEGMLEPYTFTIEEISAPAGYALSHEIHEFSAVPDFHDVHTMMYNPSDAALVNGILYVSDKPSQLTLSKADFYDGQTVPGTTLAVYEAEQKNGIWQSTGISKGADWRWTTGKKEKSHTITGLTAGGTYVLTEESYPAGYTKAEDVFFQVSPSGTSIGRIWYDPKENISITFASDSTGAVEKVTFATRTVLGTYVMLEDMEKGTGINKGTLADGSINLSSEDVEEGRRYRIREYVRYSDGSEDILGTVTFIAKLKEGWMKVDLRGDTQNLTYEITDESGAGILSFTPDDTGSYTVINPLREDPDGLTVVGQILRKTGVDHTAVQAGDTIYYEISYEGEGKEILVLPADGITYLRATGGLEKQVDGTYRTVTSKQSGKLTVVAHVEESARGYIHQQVSIGKVYSYVNPVAVNHGEGIFKDSSKLVISSAVAGTHPENRNAAFTFQVILTTADGSPLSGAYDYRTRYSNGTLYAYGEKSKFEISVNGNDFITIQDLPYNTSYKVLQIVAEQHPFVVTNTKADGRTDNTKVSNVLFTNTRNATSERSVFLKNTGYYLTEYLHVPKGDSLVLRKYGFSFGERYQIKDISLLNKPTQV